ncbi:MAG TPA: 16S rRNA (cytidine(1402)-2'-O)-methyltransferase [Longilinea sp.]|nr:16S rRNA (cytidine(1402)-2'-O)-methyltransferase [Longilinea sp.]
MSQTGCLYVVATPIGNTGDITLRAIETLRSVDGIICEEARIGTTLLKKLEIPAKELILLNEHNEHEQAANLVVRIAKGESFALISDCGTPVFADPGAFLVQQISIMELPVVPVPGTSSLMAALSVMDFKMERFVFAGFLPRDPVQRRKQLESLRYLKMAIIILDTPYRLGALMDDIGKVFGGGQRITLAMDITLPSETIFRGRLDELRKRVGPRKAEFILIVHPPGL